MSDNRPSVELVITTTAVEAVGSTLHWNVIAYGKAWTGENEDTRFICHDLSKKVLAALDEAGYRVVPK